MSKAFPAKSLRLWVSAGALALALIVLAVFMDWREQSDDRIVPVLLNPEDPSQDRLGALIYRGGLDVPRMGKNIGGLSALRWDEPEGQLVALTDDARWVRMTLDEEGSNLAGIEAIEMGPLLGIEGEALTGKQSGDSESLTRSAKGGWLVGFEHEHRIWRYPSLDALPEETGIDPVEVLGAMEDNSGLETMARSEGNLVLCAQRQARTDKANCAIHFGGADLGGPLEVRSSAEIEALGAVPTDADVSENGTLYFLFRSYSPRTGNAAELTALPQWGEAMHLAALHPPLSVDNFEGLAVREEEGRTFLYIVSDDNFSSGQRTLLMKFEVAPSVSSAQ